MAIVLAGILCFVTGFLLLALGLAPPRSRSTLLLRISLSAGFGLAVFSITYFLARWSGFLHLWAIDGASCAILLIAVMSLRKHRIGAAPNLEAQDHKTPRCLLISFGVALLAALYSGILRAVIRPYGSGWDSFAIWNLHARFLFRGGIDWRDGFSPLIPWSHPDYPLLLPAAIAHFWTVMGRETTAVPAVIGLVFTFSTVALLFSGLDILVSRTSALLGAMCLLSTPFFIDLGTWQYADVPLSFFILATLVLLHLHDRLAKGGVESRSPLRAGGTGRRFRGLDQERRRSLSVGHSAREDVADLPPIFLRQTPHLADGSHAVGGRAHIRSDRILQTRHRSSRRSVFRSQQPCFTN